VAKGADTFTVTLPKGATPYLRELMRTGLYGRTVEEVAADLVLESLRKAVANKLIGLHTL
jgi:hypothetical protein